MNNSNFEASIPKTRNSSTRLGFQHNLDVQLRWISENLREGQLNGFRYATLQPVNIDPLEVYDFESKADKSRKFAAVKSVGEVGYLSLQQFRTEVSTGGTSSSSINTAQRHVNPPSAEDEEEFSEAALMQLDIDGNNCIHH